MSKFKVQTIPEYLNEKAKKGEAQASDWAALKSRVDLEIEIAERRLKAAETELCSAIEEGRNDSRARLEARGAERIYHLSSLKFIRELLK